MHILAIETSDLTGDLALFEADRLVAEMKLPADQRSAQSLAPTLVGLLRGVAWPPATIELVAVSTGPGSFTGLRVGVATAKTLAYAVSAQVQAVDTLAAIAWQAPAGGHRLWATIDAHRRQLFVQPFRLHGGVCEPLSAASVVEIDAWLTELAAGDHVSGPGLHRCRQWLPEGVVAEAADLWRPAARTIGQLAWRQYQAGRRDDLWRLVPTYLRPSAAEEKAAGS